MGLTGQILEAEPWRKLGEAVPSLRKSLVDFFSRLTLLPTVDRALDRSVRGLDALLRRCEGITEFTQDEQCILRISLRRASKEEILPGGSRVQPGDAIGEFHLWNERIPPMPPGGADMKWGLLMRRRLQRSLIRLAALVENDPRFAEVKFICGETAFAPDKSIEHTRCMAAFFGFEIKENIRSAGCLGWLGRLGQAIYLWGMVRTFNPGALKLGGLVKPRWFQFWLTRETLLHKYSGAR